MNNVELKVEKKIDEKIAKSLEVKNVTDERIESSLNYSDFKINKLIHG